MSYNSKVLKNIMYRTIDDDYIESFEKEYERDDIMNETIEPYEGKEEVHVLYYDDHHYRQSMSLDTLKKAEDFCNGVDEENEGGVVIAVIKGVESDPLKLDVKEGYYLDFGNSKPNKDDKIYVAFYGYNKYDEDAKNNEDDDCYRIKEFNINEEGKVINFLHGFEFDADDGIPDDGYFEAIIRGKKLNLIRQKRYKIKEG